MIQHNFDLFFDIFNTFRQHNPRQNCCLSLILLSLSHIIVFYSCFLKRLKFYMLVRVQKVKVKTQGALVRAEVQMCQISVKVQEFQVLMAQLIGLAILFQTCRGSRLFLCSLLIYRLLGSKFYALQKVFVKKDSAYQFIQQKP